MNQLEWYPPLKQANPIMSADVINEQIDFNSQTFQIEYNELTHEKLFNEKEKVQNQSQTKKINFKDPENLKKVIKIQQYYRKRQLRYLFSIFKMMFEKYKKQCLNDALCFQSKKICSRMAIFD